MPDYKEIVRQSQENVKSLGEKLGSLEKLHQDIIQLKESSEGIPKTFNSKFDEIIQISGRYTETLGASAKIYLNGTNTLLSQKIEALDIQRATLAKEVSRLATIDFSDDFKQLQDVFLSEAKQSIRVEVKHFETQANDLKAQIAQLEIQVLRLEDIDLTVHFNKLQNTLSEIFGAINSINLTLTSATQALTKISSSLSNTEVFLDTNFRELRNEVGSLERDMEDKLHELRELSATNHEKIMARNDVLNDKIKDLSVQISKSDKDIKLNRMIQIGSFALLFITLIYLVIVSGSN